MSLETALITSTPTLNQHGPCERFNASEIPSFSDEGF
jgi:hypothetical protein